MNLRCNTHRPAVTALALCALAGLPAPALAQLEDEDTPVMLQWFEQRWNQMEHRAPDFFVAGYGALWLPPISETWDPDSPGYDPFDRFNLGEVGNETAYGTESDWSAARDELKNADGLIYIDGIFNHNSGRQTSGGFQAAGGYPGFWMGPLDTPFKEPTDNWGDFHAGNASGYLQSENPGGANYNTTTGDLVALIDINQASNNQFIRQPTDPLDPNNIPAGSIRNLPDPANAQYYPDIALGGTVVNNPLGPNLTFYDYNQASPMAGDAVLENATGYLMRWARWMMQVQKIDGFRLDALKHVDTFFWDQFYDAAVHMQRETPDGRMENPFSFGESTTGNSTIVNDLVRKDSFANRDALDLSGAGSLRNLKSGVGNWADPIFNSHLDNADDGLNNGSVGVNHVFSHDNGSQGDGSSFPPFPNARDQAYPMTAYVLLRPGWPIVYHNARGVSRGGGFFPRAGYTAALGYDAVAGAEDDTITTLVQIRNQYGRGYFIPLNGTDPVNQSTADSFVFERRTPTGGANLLVGVSDVYAGGFQQRNVQTSYAPGTILHELTGNASNFDIDPGNVVPDILTVDGSGRVTLVIPNNTSAITNHEKGYVVYGEILPDATLTIPESTSIIPASIESGARRITDVPVIDTPTFTLRVDTLQADPNDPNTDDGALFRINRGFQDLNNNGSTDIPYTDLYNPGFEAFLTTNQPLFGSGGAAGLYQQQISTADLDEGYNYITVRVFRYRDPAQNTAPIYRELRLPVYVDLQDPDISLAGGDNQIVEEQAFTADFTFNDRTTSRVHVFLNPDPSDDLIALSNALNLATPIDRFNARRNVNLAPGENTLAVAVFEDNRAVVQEFTITYDDGGCIADLTTTGATLSGQPGYGIPDGIANLDDLGYYLSFWLVGADFVADVTTSGATIEGQAGFGVPDGTVDLDDLGFFLNAWLAGCN